MQRSPLRRLFLYWLGIAALLPAVAHAGNTTWSASPVSGDWYTAENWVPAKVPHRQRDTATFSVSEMESVLVAADTSIDSIVFTADASGFTIVTQHAGLELSGAGITNASTRRQNLIAGARGGTSAGLIRFTDYATISGPVTIIDQPSPNNFGGFGMTHFVHHASAGDANIINAAGAKSISGPGNTHFFDNASAGNATITNSGNFPISGAPGYTAFNGYSTADHATFMNEGTGIGPAGKTAFYDHATAANGTFINRGNGDTQFDGPHCSAGNATIINEGATAAGDTIHGGNTFFYGDSHAGQATIIAKGGSNGGQGGYIGFISADDGSEATFRLYGNGTLAPPSTIGSLEGDGIVLFGTYGSYAIAIGRNQNDTVFAGTFTEQFPVGASVEKVGRGTLTLSGSQSDYTGGTIVSGGTLLIDNASGSATGTGPVTVDTGGTLGGSGIIPSAVTVNGTLAPSSGSTVPVRLTLQGPLTFANGASFNCSFQADPMAASDEVAASGITIDPGAVVNLMSRDAGSLDKGTVFVVLNNTASTPISGTFANLPDGGTVTINGNNFQASYSGGDGNDLTLTVVP